MWHAICTTRLWLRVAAMAEKKGYDGTHSVELDWHGHEAGSASIGSGPSGTVFSFSIKRVTDEALLALTAAKANNATIRLRFDAEQFLQLTIVGLEQGDSMLRVQGRIMETPRPPGTSSRVRRY